MPWMVKYPGPPLIQVTVIYFIQKREILYNESVSGYLEYFGRSRCLEIRVSAGESSVSRDLVEVLHTRLSIKRRRAVNAVTLFAFGESPSKCYLEWLRYAIDGHCAMGHYVIGHCVMGYYVMEYRVLCLLAGRCVYNNNPKKRTFSDAI